MATRSKITCGLLAWVASALLAASAALANSAPVVSNVTASQRTDGSKKVDIRYNLADGDGNACTVSVIVSNDAGSTWTVPASTLSGAVGSGVTPGSGRLIVWDCKVDLPGAFGTQYKVRVCADDGQGPQGMVLIPAGEFQMGDNLDGLSNAPVHAVYVDAFYMDRYEVTNQQYADGLNWAKGQGNLITVTSGVVYKYNSGTSYPYCDTNSSSSYSCIVWNGSTFTVESGRGNQPVVQVSWYGSVAYANWRSAMEGRPLGYNLSTWNCNFNSGYRLPTEAEWEKAARGGASGQRFPWGNTINHDHANYRACGSCYSYDTSPYTSYTYHPNFDDGGYPYTSPVDYFAPNGYGLYDMAGNVWEWCNDWYGSSYYSSSPYNNPHGPASGTYRVLRGGSWSYLAYYCRVAYRNHDYPSRRGDYYGFRLALDSP